MRTDRAAGSGSLKTGDRGQVLVLVAIAFAALLGFAALAVDVGYMYTVRHQLQRCADAGALAGASILKQDNAVTWSSPPPSIPPRRDRANSAAQYYADNNIVSTSSPSPLVLDIYTYDPNGIHVGTSCNVNLFFAPIFGMNSTTINASAEAEAALDSTGSIFVRLVR